MKKKIKTRSGQTEILRSHWESVGFLTLEPNEFRQWNHSLAIQGHPKMKKNLSQIAEYRRSILLSLWPCRSSEHLTSILNLELYFQRAKKRVKPLSIYLLTNSRNPQFQQLPCTKTKNDDMKFLGIRYVTSSIFGTRGTRMRLTRTRLFSIW